MSWFLKRRRRSSIGRRQSCGEEMEGAYPMRVPMKVDLGVGQNWKEAK